jgi:hypothetical protein
MMQLTTSGFPEGFDQLFYGADQPLFSPEGANHDGTWPMKAPSVDETFTNFGSVRLEVKSSNSETGEFGPTATLDVKMVDGFRASVNGRDAKPGTKVTYRVLGDTELAPLYLHIDGSPKRSSKVRVHKDIPLGKPSAPCGTLAVKMKALGSIKPRHGWGYGRSIDLKPHGDRDPMSLTQQSLPGLAYN